MDYKVTVNGDGTYRVKVLENYEKKNGETVEVVTNKYNTTLEEEQTKLSRLLDKQTYVNGLVVNHQLLLTRISEAV